MMSVSNSTESAPWSSFSCKITEPAFPQIPAPVRPFVLATWLFAITSGLMYVGDAALIRYGLPWGLVSLLVIIISANIWGPCPALFVLALSFVVSLDTTPQISGFIAPGHQTDFRLLILRSVLFILFGLVSVWISYKARESHLSSQRIHATLLEMRRPDTLPEPPGFDLYGSLRPGIHCSGHGGDFYDIFPNGSGQYGVVLGDVEDTPKTGTTSTAMLRYTVRTLAATGLGPSAILAHINSLSEKKTVPYTKATLFIGFLDVKTGFLSYANAGQESPLLLRTDGSRDLLSKTGPVLGTSFQREYTQCNTALLPGDTLLFASDGVTEAQDKDGFFLNNDGLWPLLQAVMDKGSANKMVSSIESAISSYVGRGKRDDMTLLLVRGLAKHS